MSREREMLEQVLDLIFQDLSKQQLLPANTNKEELIERTLNSISNVFKEGLPIDKLRDPDSTLLLQALRHAMVGAALLNNNPAFKNNVTLLNQFMSTIFSPLSKMLNQENAAEIKNDLNRQLRLFFAALYKVKDPALTPDQANKNAKELVDELDKTKENNPNATVEDAHSVILRNLYGGMDPRFTGGIVAVIHVMIANYFGYVAPGSAVHPYSTIHDAKRFDAGADPIGKENRTLLQIISKGGSVSQDLINDVYNVTRPSPSAIRPPHPPGTKTS